MLSAARRGVTALALAAITTLTGFAPPTADSATKLDPIPDGKVRERQEWVHQALNTEDAWTVTKGAGVTVAVIDSGVDDRLPELRGRVTNGPNMNSNVIGPEQKARPGRHGTAMASLIAGSGVDGGLLGVAPEATVLSLPMLPDQGVDSGIPTPEAGIMGRDSALARAIRYAANHGADVINMSLGGYGPHPDEREAVAYALSRGVVLVAAVGNDGATEYARQNGTSFWNFPAGYSGVIGVAAVDAEGRPASFSSDNLSVLVAAPGVGVPVALPGGGYESAEGTSPAAALVSGVVALIKARHPDMRPELVARALTASTRNNPSPGYDDKIGFGVVDAAAALRAADQLAGYERGAGDPENKYFGGGPGAADPPRPGPDPVRLWTFFGAALLGVVAFCWAVVALTRRVEQNAAARRRSPPYGPPPIRDYGPFPWPGPGDPGGGPGPRPPGPPPGR
ncbi:S8 family peptidase [Thermostaphylospora chromogena]|uniref:Type VII secretion-associated serine protease mycosin n=1 Tax=Thermostaphylospora chromogena TaxID=35622 RepID=A0A1H1AXM5_9ACTN|nr:S8 family serine peptidase [Thermostaphylospora chromogena]SDQ44393.1 type VII secretion-associated serine protease mycosin [Thermostaphylospora chromogena]